MALVVRLKPRWTRAVLVALLILSLLPIARAQDQAIETHDPAQRLIRAAQRAATTRGAAGPPRAASSRNLTQVGFLHLPGFNADVWAHKGFAYVGSWGIGLPGLCPATGVRIIDLSHRTNPTLVGAVAVIAGTSQEDVVVDRIHTPFFRGDLLVAGIQACARTSTASRGIDIWDVTNPRNPSHLAFWPSGPFGPGGARGVHELHLFQRGDRAYVAAAVPFSELREGRGDFRLVDVTDPRRPVQVSDWGAERDLGLPRSPELFDHSAFTNRDGTMAVLSYWDAGAIFLDISNPARPTFIGRTIYPPGADGDTHSLWFAHGEQLLLTADEDDDLRRDGTRGFLRIWDVSHPATPVEIGRFATPHTTIPIPPLRDGIYTIHNPFVRGKTAYLSWYTDGVRVVDISQPRSPREIASFVPPDVRDPFRFFPDTALVWGVTVHRGLVLASDINAGLYVLRLRGRR